MIDSKRIWLKSRVLSLVAAFSAAMIFSGCGWCCNKEHNFEKKVDWVASKLTSELKLTKEQTASLEKIKSDILQKKKMQKDGMMKIDTDITALVKGATMEKGKLKELFMKRETAWKTNREEMRDFIFMKFEEFHKVLTPEQRSKLAQLYEKHKKQHKRMMHEHMY